MSDSQDTIYHIPLKKALNVLKVLGNEPRFNILTLLMKGPMSISEIARKIQISQPTVTTYVQQLEENGLVFTRLQRAAKGYIKLCYSLYSGISLEWDEARQKALESVYELDMPVGHYSSMNCSRPSLLANQGGILASSDDLSRFFHPIRMEAELLAMTQGVVKYLFPYNMPPEKKIHRIELSAELNIAQRHHSALTNVTLSINNCNFTPLRLDVHDGIKEHSHILDWYPKDMTTCGNLYVWQIDNQQTTLNSEPCGDFSLKDLQLQSMQPIEVSFNVESPHAPAGGMVIFGKSFGRYNQDLRLTIVCESDSESETREE